MNIRSGLDSLLESKGSILLAVLLTILSRIFFSLMINGIHFDYVGAPGNDAWEFIWRAKQFLINPNNWFTTYHPPLYSFFLIGVLWFSGQGYLQIVISHIFLSVLGLFVFWDLVKMIAGKKVAGISALIYSIYPELIVISGLLLIENIYIPLIIIFFNLCVRLENDNRVGLSRWFKGYLLGLVLGLSTLARPEIIIALFALPIWVSVRLKNWGRVRWWLILFVFLGFIAVVLPWTLRNYVVFGEFVPICTETGEALNGPNRPDSGGSYGKVQVDRVNAMSSPERELVAMKSQYQEFFKRLTERPFSIVKILPLKLLNFFSFYSRDTNIPWRFWMYFTAGLLTYIPLMVFAIIGFVFYRKHWKKIYIFFLFYICKIITVLIFYGNIRARAPVLPFYFFLASVGLFYMLKLNKE